MNFKDFVQMVNELDDVIHMEDGYDWWDKWVGKEIRMPEMYPAFISEALHHVRVQLNHCIFLGEIE